MDITDHAAPRASSTSAHSPLKRRQRGTSLVEMAFVTTVAAILISFSAPSVAAFVRNQQMRDTAESLRFGLISARAEAIKRGEPVRFTLRDWRGTRWMIGCGDDFGCGRAASLSPTESKRHGVMNLPSPMTARTVTFGPLGQVVPNEDGSDSLMHVETVDPSRKDSPHIRVNLARTGLVSACVDALDVSTTLRRCGF